MLRRGLSSTLAGTKKHFHFYRPFPGGGMLFSHSMGKVAPQKNIPPLLHLQVDRRSKREGFLAWGRPLHFLLSKTNGPEPKDQGGGSL